MTSIVEATSDWLVNGTPVPAHDEIIEKFGQEFLMYRKAWSKDDYSLLPVGRTKELFSERDDFIRQFGFAIPCKELLDALVENQPVVEIGAGSGYMTMLMRHRGVKVVGTDSRDGAYSFQPGAHDPYQLKMTGKAAVRRYKGRTVFCSWPSLGERWFLSSLRAMAPGQKLILVEEDACASDDTWRYRDENFTMEKDIPLPAWPYMNDRAGLWVKK